MCRGLYVFSVEGLNEGKTQRASCVSLKKPSINSFSVTFNNDSAVMLEHYSLGHPNFSYLEKKFPYLFINKNSKSFQCEICQLAKHVVQVILIIFTKNLILFL